MSSPMNTDSFLGRPILSLQTMLRLLANDNPEIPHLIPDGIYGDQTVQGVSAFQRQHKLPVTGVVNEQTWQAIFAAYQQAKIGLGPATALILPMTPNQQIDAEHPCLHLWLIQAMLHVIGQLDTHFPSVCINGAYDAQTSTAVEALQDICALTACHRGCMDKMTWNYLARLYRALTNTAPNASMQAVGQET